MFSKIFLTLALLSSFSTFAGTINGSFGANKNSLDITEIDNKTTHLQGVFLNRIYDCKIEKNEGLVTISGVVEGVNSELKIKAESDLIIITDTLTGSFLKVDKRHFSTFVEGSYKNRNSSLRIDKHEELNVISGFYNGHLNDLRIFKNKEVYKFDGYINGYWTNLEVINNHSTIQLSGRLMNKDVDLVISRSNMTINDLFEFIVLGFYLPNQDVFVF